MVCKASKQLLTMSAIEQPLPPSQQLQTLSLPATFCFRESSTHPTTATHHAAHAAHEVLELRVGAGPIRHSRANRSRHPRPQPTTTAATATAATATATAAHAACP